MESANHPGCDFPIQNLPLGVFRAPREAQLRIGVAIGDAILDAQDWLPGDTLNAYMSLSASDRRDLRHKLSEVLQRGAAHRPLFSQADCQMLLPARIGDYTDFYASLHHARNVGSLFRPDRPLFDNYLHVPIAYHGRASSIVVSDTPVHRPAGQLAKDVFGPTKELDYELEIGAFIGPGNKLGEPISIAEAERHIAGLCLLNDWSARDIQRWEYQPLGPFLAKNFATSISPWLVTWEALEPFRVTAQEHPVAVLPYLSSHSTDALDITLEVWLRPAGASTSTRISRSSFKDMYWTIGQMIAHHTSNGCPLRPGDLIGSGTVSGPEKENRGCLLEWTRLGAEPLHLPTGDTRLFLQDGDEVTFIGYCDRPGFARIGFGACRGIVLPNADLSDSSKV